MKFYFGLIVLAFSSLAWADQVTCTSKLMECSAGDPHDICEVARLSFSFSEELKTPKNSRLVLYSFEALEMYRNIKEALVEKNIVKSKELSAENSSLEYLDPIRLCHGYNGSFEIWETDPDDPYHPFFVGHVEIKGHDGVLMINSPMNQWQETYPIRCSQR